MPATPPPADGSGILVIGAGELGASVLSALTRHVASRPRAANIAVLLRPREGADARSDARSKELTEAGIAIEHADVATASEGEDDFAAIYGQGAYDPVAFPDKAKDRMDWVLEKMYEEEFISQEQYEAGKATQIADILHVTETVGGCGAAGQAAYFCEYVRGEIENSELFGATEAERRQRLLRGGLNITTTALLEQVKAGKVTTDRLLPALQAQLAPHEDREEDEPRDERGHAE